MGLDSPCRTEEENITYEEAPSTDGRQGAEGRYRSSQVFRVWEAEESAYVMSLLCAM